MAALAALMVSLAASPAIAQQLSPSPDEQSVQNREAAVSIIARDGVEGAFTDASTPTEVVVAHIDSGLTCAGSPDLLHLSFSSSDTITTAACEEVLDEAASGDYVFRISASRLTARALMTLRQGGVQGDPEDVITRVVIQHWTENNAGRPWAGFRAGEDAEGPPPARPYNIVRLSGARDGRELYFRMAWVRVGDWMLTQRVEVPMENQRAAEVSATLQFLRAMLTVLLAAQP